MQKNMGTIDRIVRTAAAVAIAALYLGGWISGAAAVVLGAIAAAFVLTSLVGWCPAYAPIGLSTRRRVS